MTTEDFNLFIKNHMSEQTIVENNENNLQLNEVQNLFKKNAIAT